MDLALNNLQRLICHKTKQTKPNQTWIIFLITFELTINFWFNNKVPCKILPNYGVQFENQDKNMQGHAFQKI